MAETEVYDVPMPDPGELEIRPVAAPGRHFDAQLVALEGRKGRDYDRDTKTWSEVEGKPTLHFRVFVIDETAGPITVFHEEPMFAKSGSRVPKWLAQLGVPRTAQAGMLPSQLATALNLPMKVSVEVGINKRGDRNTLLDIAALA